MFGEILDDNGLTQIVEEPTRLNNILDLILTNCPNQISRTHIISGISDHNVVHTELDIPRRVPLYKKAGWTGLTSTHRKTCGKHSGDGSYVNYRRSLDLL